MPDDWSYSFSLPNLPKGRSVTGNEAETLLLSRLGEAQVVFEEAIWQLVRFYSSTDQQGRAKQYLEFLMGLTDDPERIAGYWLALGQTAEQANDFPEAVHYYKTAFSMEPSQSRSWYLINNNLGYSLIQLGEFAEAEQYCRAAIEIDPSRHNAYKNLGLSLDGQGKHAEAARYFVQAVRANAGDRRALDHLEALLDKYPEVATSEPDIAALVSKSKEAVELATGVAQVVEKDRMAESPELTHAEKILLAVHRIVILRGEEEFARDDIRRELGLSAEAWMAGYTAVFQAMRADEPGGAPRIGQKYRGVFRRVRHGVHALTPNGYELVRRIHEL